MKINKELPPRSDVPRIYVSRKKGGRDLISCENILRGEENNLSWYIKNSREILLRKVGETRIIDTEDALEPNA